MRVVIDAIEGEFRRYRKIADGAIEQVSDADLHVGADAGNTIATLVQHLGANLKSRFSDFLTSDGEKPWRDREGEFADIQRTRAQLLSIWEDGWATLFTTLAALDDSQLEGSVVIRGVSLSVMDALTRSLAHAAYHTGQIVLIARSARGTDWKFLSIPPGGTAAYNANPSKEKA